MWGSVRFAFVALAALTATFATPASTTAQAATSCTATGPIKSYLNWFDNSSPGMMADNIHIVNVGAGPSSGCVTVGGGQGVFWGVGPGEETYVTMPAGTHGGPVQVTVNNYVAGAAIAASQRVQFYSAFSELWATSSTQAATTSYFSWYDRSTPGMVNDNIHVANLGTVDATVTVSLPGATAQTIMVPAGTEGYASFPQGTIGGPVTVTSTQPVLASQRVQYYSSFNEVWASTAPQAATKSYFNWFDVTSPGEVTDNIHILNPGTTTANVSISIPNSNQATASIAPGGEAVLSLPDGVFLSHCIPCQQHPPMGGPLTVSSDQPVLASERVQFYSSFSEILAAGPSQAATSSHFNWYDKASPGMYNDNVHLSNPGTVDASVTVTLAGAPPQTITVVGGNTGYVNFPGQIGGPVTVSSTQPVLVSQRVQYYRSFSEVWSG